MIYPPLQREATDTIVRLVQDHPNHTSLVALHSLGKEDLLVAMAVQLGVWVGVTQDRYDILKVLEVSNVFTTDVGSCQVQALPFYSVLKSV